MQSSLIMSRLVVSLCSLRHHKRYASPHLLSIPLTLASLSPIAAKLQSAYPRVCIRGVKTSTTVKLDDLPQGLIPLEPLPLEQDESAPVYPTVVQQARNHMRKFDNCVLLTRVGGFYELYFEHADEYGPLLNLKVGSKKTANAPPISIAGFPFFQLDRYLKILVQDLNRYVAIAEEFPRSASERVKSGGLLNDRKVSRIITPGTLIDENFMDPFSNNYVLAIHIELSAKSSDVVGLAWIDLSTGHFFLQSTTLTALPSFLARISPREIVLDEGLENSKDHGLFESLAEDRHIITYQSTSEVKPMGEWASQLESSVPQTSVESFTTEEVAAGSSLLDYVATRLQSANMKLQPPVRQIDVMGIDKHTMRALEIKKTMREDVLTGSLLHVVRKTVTKGGARLLETWLSSPSTSLDVINSRLDLVTYMQENGAIQERLIMLLRRSHDSQRLLQKFAFGRGDPDDLLDLASTIQATEDLVETLKDDGDSAHCIMSLLLRINLDGPLALTKKIRTAIDEEGLVQQHRLEERSEGELQALAQAVVDSTGTVEDAQLLPQTPKGKTKRTKKKESLKEHYSDDADAWTMQPRASPTLQQLHAELLELYESRLTLTRDLSDQLGASSLLLRFSPGLGHFCHVKGKDARLPAFTTSSTLRTVSSTKSTRSFYYTAWTSLGQKIVQTKARIRAEEIRVFNTLREATIHNISSLRRNASVLAEIDIACSFAVLANEKGWVRPVLNNSTAHKIVAGRHPTVEGGLQIDGRTFVTNPCSVGAPKSTWLLTGPNMAGKSTFLRQNALITILAQTGSYVPASFAEIGIVDQIFSRVGSADNLYKDQSTFMVEMLETAHILKNATPRSFVIMDEVGRGTTPADGTAVAFACLWYLTTVNQCRTLFATHFHSLSELVEKDAELRSKIGFYCTDVKVDKNGMGFRFLHQLKPGVNRQSHALRVARLAGFPEEALRVAKDVAAVGGE